MSTWTKKLMKLCQASKELEQKKENYKNAVKESKKGKNMKN